jgi:putative NIF3 family GTP cyclohydrolase 1 type 2
MAETIQAVIDRITSAASAATPLSAPRRVTTVDTISLGDPSQLVTGIVSTFMGTDEVIEQAIQHKANLIISHETIFYNHEDKVDWLQNDPVYEAKCRKILEHNLVVWRFHDMMHDMQPDMTVTGLIEALGWDGTAVPGAPSVCDIPVMTLGQLTAHVKERLGIDSLRAVGNLDQQARRVALLPGFAGKERHMDMLRMPMVDAVICGELHEWETSEYVRDAVHLGRSKGLIVMGHAQSEEPGMRSLVTWLQSLIPDVPVDFIPSGILFHWL